MAAAAPPPSRGHPQRTVVSTGASPRIGPSQRKLRASTSEEVNQFKTEVQKGSFIGTLSSRGRTPGGRMLMAPGHPQTHTQHEPFWRPWPLSKPCEGQRARRWLLTT